MADLTFPYQYFGVSGSLPDADVDALDGELLTGATIVKNALLSTGDVSVSGRSIDVFDIKRTVLSFLDGNVWENRNRTALGHTGVKNKRGRGNWEARMVVGGTDDATEAFQTVIINNQGTRLLYAEEDGYKMVALFEIFEMRREDGEDVRYNVTIRSASGRYPDWVSI